MSTHLARCANLCIQQCRKKLVAHAIICVLDSSSNYYSTEKKIDYSIYFHTLELANNSDQEQVRISFLKLVKKYHPDCGSPHADPEKFHQIENAYRMLQTKFAEDRWNVNNGAGEYGLYYQEKPKEFDIKHTAPQHRHYLNYEGLGHGSPQQREKQYQKHRARSALDSVYNHRLSKLTPQEPALMIKNKQEAKKIKLHSEMDRLVEDLIRESIARGEFDNLRGSGKPLHNHNANPYVDFVTHKMNEVMINNGYVPEWITLQKEIQEDAEKIRTKLSKARSCLGHPPLTPDEREKWEKAVGDQLHVVDKLNKKINDFNLQVPLLNKQKVYFQLNMEAKKVLENGKTKFEVCQERVAECSRNQPNDQQTLFSFFESLFTGRI